MDVSLALGSSSVAIWTGEVRNSHRIEVDDDVQQTEVAHSLHAHFYLSREHL